MFNFLRYYRNIKDVKIKTTRSGSEFDFNLRKNSLSQEYLVKFNYKE